MRTIMPCRRPDEAVIEGFACSHCNWFHAIAARPFEVPEEEVREACREFELHACANYPFQAHAECA